MTSERGPGIKHLGSKETTALVDAVQTWKYSVDIRQHGFFVAKKIRESLLDVPDAAGDDDGNLRPQTPNTPSLSELGFLWSVGSLASYENGFFDNTEPEDRFVCFADPSTYPNNPSWHLRNLLVLVRQRWHLDEVQILCYRDTHVRREHPTSLVMQLQSAQPAVTDDQPQAPSANMPLLPKDPKSTEEPLSRLPNLPKITGWERNEKNKIISRTVDLASYLDPSRLADQAVDLNLKLIKWRISPSIDLDTIKHTKCLLLGAGTLGSYVARNLMGWGVRKITFVDNGRVSYSNPVRQPLFDFKDCIEGGARKAERAAEALQEIYPGVEAAGHVMSVPMAGHPIMDEDRVRGEYEKLRSLIDEHDAIFLLMDTRESRWLPTVMAKAAGKIVINAALGFDTYMVMRHGLRSTAPVLSKPEKPNTAIPAGAASNRIPAPKRGEEELGCYYCSDVVAPADSLKSATLDQQCTVTRPGVAPLASALAVELLVSITQHRLKGRAPAPQPATTSASHIQSAPPTDPTLPDSHPLGTVPHQLRGFLSTWQTIIIKGKAYDCCAGCSPAILKAYEDGGWDFVKRAINEKGYVEEVSGLAEVQRLAEEADKDVEWDSEEDDGDGEGEML